MPPTPTRKQGGAMLAQEGERWIVTLFSCFGPKAPEDLAGFIDFSRRLPQPEIYDVIRTAEPLGDAAHYNFPSSVRRRYESLSRFPEGLLVIGDGLCGFNPVYGQGMSVAALEAMELGDVLAKGRRALARRFFRRAAAIIDNPWSIAVGGDLRMVEVEAPRNPAIRILNWYMAHLHTAAHSDPEVARAFGRVMNLVAAPSSLLQPRLAARVLWAHLPMRKKSVPPPMRATA
jgi:2-polyprenyl-6-methoxyphenol hydroxylase-like FAD-dependent oxidoreductase